MKARMLFKQTNKKPSSILADNILISQTTYIFFRKYSKNQNQPNKWTQGLHKIIAFSSTEDSVAVEVKFDNPKYAFEFFLFHYFYY